MEIKLSLGQEVKKSDLLIVGAFVKGDEKKSLDNSKWQKEVKEAFAAVNASSHFTGEAGQSFSFYLEDGRTVLAYGLGAKKKFKNEELRRAAAKVLTAVLAKKYAHAVYDLDTFMVGKVESTVGLMAEALTMTDYNFDMYKSKKTKSELKTVTFYAKGKSAKSKKVLEEAVNIGESINKMRDFINMAPNDLNSETYSKEVEKDVKANLKGVKVKMLGKKELKKEKMNLFLSVNAGSAYDPRLVHLTYTPKKVTKNTKHIVLVGKGLTFDTGGYSLKPGAAMAGMKFDMGGSATVYGAFRAAALLGVNVKVTCLMGMTDNAVNSKATMPDSIVKGRNGKTVEILNTDAEGRLVLADVLDYACDMKPDAIIDAATLTGACLMALGSEVGGLMTNNQKLADKLLKSAKNVDEYLWQLPIVDEWRKDMKSDIADLKNIGGSRFAGTAKAAAFLEEFIKDDIAWAHFDVAGVADSAAHLPYCPNKGGSGIMVRTMLDYIKNA